MFRSTRFRLLLTFEISASSFVFVMKTAKLLSAARICEPARLRSIACLNSLIKIDMEGAKFVDLDKLPSAKNYNWIVTKFPEIRAGC